MTAPSSPAALDAVAAALAALRAERASVGELARRATELRDTVRWNAPSARAFEARVGLLENLLGLAGAACEDASDELRRVRARLVLAGAAP